HRRLAGGSASACSSAVPGFMANGFAPGMRCAAAKCWSKCAVPCSTTLKGSACVAEPKIAFVPALEGIARAGRYGRVDGDPGVMVAEGGSAGVAPIVARGTGAAALADRLGSAFGVRLPAAGRWAREETPTRGLALVWSGPERWLACRIPAP